MTTPLSGPVSWFIAMTDPQGELTTATRLRDDRYQAHVPCERVTISHARRKIEVERPLLPRYLFVGLNSTQLATTGFRRINSTIGIREVLCGTERQPRRIPEKLVDEFREAESLGLYDRTTRGAPGLKPGALMRIRAGRFAGFVCAIHAATSSKDRVAVLLHWLGAARVTTLRLECLEPL